MAETIKDLQAADIKIWMLTGDKLETAENIGHLTNLISPTTKIFHVRNGSQYQTVYFYIYSIIHSFNVKELNSIISKENWQIFYPSKNEKN